MKKSLLFIICFVNMLANAQDFKRLIVDGKIIVESNDVSGITVFNTSSNKGAVTDDNGEFKLAVRLNDIITVSALQFQNIEFKVNQSIMASLKMKIFLIEEINALPEIVLLPNKLTGELEADMQKTKRFTPKLNAFYYGIKSPDIVKFEPDNKSQVQNTAIARQHVTMVKGLNIKNVVDQLLLPLFRSKADSKEEKGIPEVPVDAIKYYFGSEFLTDNFNIPEHRVEEFIRYVERDGFDYGLLNYGNEMQFLELLHTESQAFLNNKK